MTLRTIRRPILVVAALVAGLAGLVMPAPAQAQPAPGTCPPVRVTGVELVRTVDGPGLHITGVKPGADVFVRLEAEDVVFVQQPPYWRYFVVGCGTAGPVVKTPFSQTFPFPTGPVGRYGIDVAGFQIDFVPGI
jgi:hypothetical protein